MVAKDHISKQVDAAIEFGDEKLIRRLLMIARKKSLVSEEDRLKSALKRKDLYIPSIKEKIESIGPDRIEKIKSRYENGESIKSLAISFGLKASLINRLVAKWNIKDKYPIKSIGTYESFIETYRKQINLRLDEDSLSKLSQIYEYWKSKGGFKFLDKENPDVRIFNSEVSFSKFILETALNNLFIDMENEKQIDYLAKWIAEVRVKNKNIKTSWYKLKDLKIETWNLRVKELNEYIDNINKLEKENLYKRASDELKQINREFFEIIWPISISRSHLISDEENDSSDTNLKIARLKSIYWNNEMNQKT